MLSPGMKNMSAMKVTSSVRSATATTRREGAAAPADNREAPRDVLAPGPDEPKGQEGEASSTVRLGRS